MKSDFIVCVFLFQICPKRLPHKVCFCRPSKHCVCDVCDAKTYHQKFSNAIKDWTKNIPVNIDLSDEDKKLREEMLNKLANRLKELENDKDFYNKAKIAVHDCLNAIPMWHPSDIKKDALLKQQLADDLIGRIAKIAESVFEEEIAKGTKLLPINHENINEEQMKELIDRIANRLKQTATDRPSKDEAYIEALKSNITDLLQDIPFRDESENLEIKSELADEFAKRLGDIKVPLLKHKDKHQSAHDKVKMNLNTPKLERIKEEQIEGLKEKKTMRDGSVLTEHIGPNTREVAQKNKIEFNPSIEVPEHSHVLEQFMNSEDLDSSVLHLKRKKTDKKWFRDESIESVEEISSDESKTKDGSTYDLIKKWLLGIPELAIGNKTENIETTKDLATQLDLILESGESGNIQADMKEAIKNWLHHMLRKSNKQLNSAVMENLVNELVKQVHNPNKTIRHMQEEGNMYNDIVSLRDIPGIETSAAIYHNDAMEDLINELGNIKDDSEGENSEEQARDAINNFIDNMPDNNREKIGPRERKLLENQLFRQMRQEPRRKRWNKQRSLGSSTPKAHRRSFISPNLSPVRKFSLENGLADIEQFMNELNNEINDWIKSLDLKLITIEQNKVISDIASDVVDRLKYLQLSNNKSSETEEMEHLKYEVFRRLNKFNLEDLQSVIAKVDNLYKHISALKVPELIKPVVDESRFKRNANYLVNSMKTWFASVPTHLVSSLNKPNSAMMLDLANKIVERDDTVNYYPIKNDILQCLGSQLSELDVNALNNLADSLISHLINDLSQDETAGSTYRQTLRDTTSKTLPSAQVTTIDELHKLDMLKEKLIDAFIILHYFADDVVLPKFKAKLFEELNKFCDEYLKQYPASPMKTEELQTNLYNVLRRVSIPNIETVRSELEQVRLKADIRDWIQQVPIDKSKITEPLLDAMTSDLAKNLYNIEKDKQNPNKDTEMLLEIKKWLEKVPTKDETYLENLGEILRHNLESTENIRTLNVSNIGKYDDDIIRGHVSRIHPNCLCASDRAHLNRIRRRQEEYGASTSKAVSVSPLQKEKGIQSEIDSRSEGTAQTHPSLNERDREISPRVIIKEYYWNSTASSVNMSKKTDDSKRPCTPCNEVPEMTKICLRRTATAQTDDVLNKNYPQRQELTPSKRINSTKEKSPCIRASSYIPVEINNTHPQRQDSIPDKRTYTSQDSGTCRRPACHFPEETQTNQRTNLRSKVIECKRSRIEYCCNCGQRIYSMCRARNPGYRPHCNVHCLKYCPNCQIASSCPYPSKMFFRRGV